MRFIYSLATSVVVIAAALGIVVLPAHALQCGDKIVANTTLYTNLGPCPGSGLIITASNVTLDLNGHAITGTPNGTGVAVVEESPATSEISRVTIKGPGVIAGFAVGISVGGYSSDVMVYGLTLIGNGTGVKAGGRTSEIRVVKNTIVGLDRQTIGVDFWEPLNVHIYNNTFRGHSEALRLGLTSGVFVTSNVVTGNKTGIFASFPGCLYVRGNEITRNRGDGIIFSALGLSPAAATMATAAELCPTSSTVEGNTVKSNGGNGIVVYGPLHLVVDDNIVSANSTTGIKVIAYQYGGSGVSQVIGNYLSRNGTDLFWDGVGTDNCWRRNVFETSSPQTLPECQ